TFTYAACDSAGQINTSTISTMTINFTCITISGNVYNDTNGLRDNNVNGTGINKPSTTQVYANLLNSSNIVIATIAVDNNGTFSFTGITPASYTVQVSTNQGAVSSSAPATSLPTQWVNTGENLGSTSGSDGTIDGKLSLTLSTSNITNANFGIEQRPMAMDTETIAQINPGGTTNVTVSPGLFVPFDTGGRVDSLSIISFPNNVTSITINGTTYTSGSFPSGGVKVPTNSVGQPTQTITIDPINGAISVNILFKPFDNAGFPCINPWTITIPFELLSISGNVYNDLNALVDNTVNGTGINNPNSNQLVAYIIDGINTVVAKVNVNTNGTFTFNNQYPGSYNVMVTNNNSANPGNPSPPVALPSNWIYTGENLGAGSGSDGTVNGKLAITLVTTNIANANFGIEQLCAAYNKSYTGLNANDFNKPSSDANYPFKLSLNDSTGTADGVVNGYSSAVRPGKVSGSDPEDGNYGGATGSSGLRKFVITTLPDSANDVIVYFNGTINISLSPGPSNTDSSYIYWNAASSRYEIPNFDPSNLNVFLRKNGHMSFSFTYGWKDSANELGALATYSVSAFSALPVTWLGFTAKWQGIDAKLDWSTTYEVDNKYFEVQRSINGKDFEYLFTIEAAEKSGVNNYTYTDVNAGKLNASHLYYRIKQTDWNGESSYSIIKTLSKANNAASTSYSVFPNPFLTTYNIAINTTEEKSIACTVQSIDGKVVYTVKYNLRKGSNTLTMSELETMPAGIYMITIADGQKTEILKITKVNNY
ncbi:MAG: T9SS type A sorting domain-containing protein, partial [Bacteroidota bacterium]|nr:T9SS type A sorting domain-containing protein [Bacteroidota bacterium]